MGTNWTKAIEREIKKGKWSWIGHTLRKPSGRTVKDALDWNPQGKRKRGQPKETWRRNVEEEVREQSKRWHEVTTMAENSSRPYAPYGSKRNDDDCFVVVCITKVSITTALLLLNTVGFHLPDTYARHVMFTDGGPSHEF
jgi:hypothetical protein